MTRSSGSSLAGPTSLMSNARPSTAAAASTRTASADSGEIRSAYYPPHAPRDGNAQSAGSIQASPATRRVTSRTNSGLPSVTL
jgi:hypothetical protein